MLLFRLYIAFRIGGGNMDFRKDLLLASAARLYSMGVDLESARERLKILVEQGVGYDSDEMKRAYKDFKELELQWKTLEQQHIELRDDILKDEQS